MEPIGFVMLERDPTRRLGFVFGLFGMAVVMWLHVFPIA